MTPTQRSLALARKRWGTAAVVEKWQPLRDDDHAPGGRRGYRKDLWGFADILAIDGAGTYAIQAGGLTGHAAHRRKITVHDAEARECPHCRAGEWLLNPDRHLYLWSWGKRVLKGRKRPQYRLREERIHLADLNLCRVVEHDEDGVSLDTPKLAPLPAVAF